jgi:Tol biopolymer transport system component
MTFARELVAFGTSCLLFASATPMSQQDAPASSIAFASHRDGNWEIYVTDGNGQNQTRLTRRNGHTRFPLWSPDRSHIAFAAQQAERADGWDFWVMKEDGSDARRLCSGLVGKSHREWSRDGRRIALTARADSNVDVYVVDVASTRLTRLTTSAAEDRDPTWSADGAHIAFSSERDGNREIYLVRPDGTVARRLTNHAAKDGSPVWSPDGSRIAFVSDRDGSPEVYVIQADGTALQRLTRGAHASSDPPRWSPDGSHIAYQIADQARYDIGIVRLRDRQQRVVVATPHNDGSYTWSPDGQELTYISGPGGRETLHAVNVMTGKSRQLTTTWSLTPDWSR